jgi:hypothetical protein
MPRASPLATAAGADAVQASFRTAAPVDSVAGWYRQWLLQDGWLTAGDTRGADGSVTLHAQKAGRPVWVLIQPAPGGSTFSVIGAETDSSARSGPPN